MVSCLKFAVYADDERGRYTIWQNLDLDGFVPGSGVIFATVTVATVLTHPGRFVLTVIEGRLRETCRGDDRRTGAIRVDGSITSDVPGCGHPGAHRFPVPALEQRPALSRKL
jgi:hypothetical protein